MTNKKPTAGELEDKAGFVRKDLYEWLQAEGFELTDARHKKLKKFLTRFSAINLNLAQKNYAAEMRRNRKKDGR